MSCCPRPTISTRCATRSSSASARPQSAQLVWRPKTTVAGRRGHRDEPLQAARNARRQRRRAERLRQFRGRRRRHGAAERVMVGGSSCPSRAGEGAPQAERVRAAAPTLTLRAARWASPACARGINDARSRPRSGLRHTGWGVIDVDGNRLRHVADGVVQRADRPAAGRAAGRAVPPARRGARALSARRGGGRGDFRQQEPGLDPEARRGARRGAAGAGRARPAGRRIFRQPGQEIGGRRRPCREGADADDGAPPAARLRRGQGRRRRRARGRDLPRASRRHHDALADLGEAAR